MLRVAQHAGLWESPVDVANRLNAAIQNNGALAAEKATCLRAAWFDAVEGLRSWLCLGQLCVWLGLDGRSAEVLALTALSVLPAV